MIKSLNPIWKSQRKSYTCMKCKCRYPDEGNLDRLKKDLDLHEAQEDKDF